MKKKPQLFKTASNESAILFVLLLFVCTARAEDSAFDAKNLKTDQWFLITRDKKTNEWLEPAAFDKTAAEKVLKALDKSKKWDGNSNAAAYGFLHAETPAVTISIAATSNNSELKEKQIVICYGNHLFWFKNDVYQVDADGFKALKIAFPDNCDGTEK